VTGRGRAQRLFWPAAWLFAVLAAVWIAHDSNTVWDYPNDAGPPIDALVHLRIHDFLSARPDMGPLSLILRAPFAALGQALGHGGRPYAFLDDYRFGVFPCVLAAGLLGMALARILEQEQRGLLARAAVVVLAVVNPVSLRAIHFGHPEELVGAALLAGAAVAAVLRRPALGAALLALAIVNKQWAVIGAPAVLVTLAAANGWRALVRPFGIVIAIAVALTVPLLVVDASSLVSVFRRMADLRGSYLFPADIWYPFGGQLGAGHFVQASRGLRSLPDWIAVIARPLIVTMGVVVPLLLARRVAGNVRERALPMLALVMLLRCALDPADNGYYHVPFFLALLCADAFGGRFYATAAAAVLLQLPTTLQPTPEQLNAFYIAWALPFAVYLAGRSYGLDWATLVRSRVARGQAAAQQARSSSSAARTQ
jgi:hypothetical protein